MVDYKELIAALIAQKIQGATKEELKDYIEIPGDEKMGDYAFPCFRLAKVMRKAPPAIAKEIGEAIGGADIFDKVETINGYVNMRGFESHHPPHFIGV